MMCCLIRYIIQNDKCEILHTTPAAKYLAAVTGSYSGKKISKMKINNTKNKLKKFKKLLEHNIFGPFLAHNTCHINSFTQYSKT